MPFSSILASICLPAWKGPPHNVYFAKNALGSFVVSTTVVSVSFGASVVDFSDSLGASVSVPAEEAEAEVSVLSGAFVQPVARLTDIVSAIKAALNLLNDLFI